jgi:hypothetical protein
MFLFSYSNPVCLHAARIVVLVIAASYARKSLKMWWTCIGNVSSRIWYFWIAWQSRIIIHPELEIYVTAAAGTWEQEPHFMLTSLALNSTCELSNCHKIKWPVLSQLGNYGFASAAGIRTVSTYLLNVSVFTSGDGRISIWRLIPSGIWCSNTARAAGPMI